MLDNEIISRIARLYPDAIIDVCGEDCSFEVYVISHGMKGKSTLQRQQSILALFKDELQKGELHALSITARTPKEQNQQSQAGLVQIKP